MRYKSLLQLREKKLCVLNTFDRTESTRIEKLQETIRPNSSEATLSNSNHLETKQSTTRESKSEHSGWSPSLKFDDLDSDTPTVSRRHDANRPQKDVSASVSSRPTSSRVRPTSSSRHISSSSSTKPMGSSRSPSKSPSHHSSHHGEENSSDRGSGRPIAEREQLGTERPSSGVGIRGSSREGQRASSALSSRSIPGRHSPLTLEGDRDPLSLHPDSQFDHSTIRVNIEEESTPNLIDEAVASAGIDRWVSFTVVRLCFTLFLLGSS